jgi:BACON domain-containing protein
MPRRSIHRTFFCIFALLSVAAMATAQQRTRKEPAIYPGPGGSDADSNVTAGRALPPSRSITLARPGKLALGGLSAEESAGLGPVGFPAGLKQRTGVHRAIAHGSLARGTWTPLAGGRRIWRMEIQSDAAVGLRVEFSNFSVGEGKVWVHSGATVDGPYTARGPYGNGEFWSGTVDGESAVIEYEAPGGAANGGVVNDDPPFHVHRIAHKALSPQADAIESAASIGSGTSIGVVSGFEFAGSGTVALGIIPPVMGTKRIIDPAAECNQDINCYSDWMTAKKSVALIQYEETVGPQQGTFLCSGSLMATRDNSFDPYLLTSSDCIHDESAARSLETFWAYESTGCNLGPPANRGTLNSQNGGHLLAWSSILNGDYSLVLLPNVPAGVVFAGWDTSDPVIGSPVSGIHHPMGSYKRIAFGNTVAGLDEFVGTAYAAANLYHQVDYTLGVVEPGSVGSPLFSSPGVVVGTLSYGPTLSGAALCALGGEPAGYGKFSNAYTGLQAYFEDFPFSEVEPSTTNVNFAGLNNTITGSATQTIALTTQAAAAVSFALQTESPWVSVSPSSGSISASSPVQVQVTVNPAFLTQSDMYTTPVTLTTGAAPPLFVNVNVNMVINTSNVVVSASPDPVPDSGNSWSLSLQLQEINGSATTVTQMKINGVDYTSSIASFFGTNLIPANGTISGPLHTTGLAAPLTEYFEFSGKDVLSGTTWYRMLPVTFNNY